MLKNVSKSKFFKFKYCWKLEKLNSQYEREFK